MDGGLSLVDDEEQTCTHICKYMYAHISVFCELASNAKFTSWYNMELIDAEMNSSFKNSCHGINWKY
ncbi:hypothetical protein SERLA73DRAFT_129778 [Serpula lacrymans var. lacrymans S7.3]|uniref:Uncharacterized protein n=2 Tax=Serpula lacrymans var. lacrymans TaxID=341189 RepID=F8PJQ0_SERL3|nr:uncharacterized protein SERLADRAFT_365240 [Serpula lacrymans var. lacrymans S7.9]EGO03460.1 hypothetical protein SERLA73DRAFT_129778 [Serpula lacrymans var. lacrymans S7.3]EGO29220.1 hypothetical protein SERLADRAFT_365240 [Serpula lacrymans var. lacrymans S7.9]